MKTNQVLSRLEGASGSEIMITTEEAKAILSQVNFLENVISSLLTSMKKRKRVLDVQIPYRAAI